MSTLNDGTLLGLATYTGANWQQTDHHAIRTFKSLNGCPFTHHINLSSDLEGQSTSNC